MITWGSVQQFTTCVLFIYAQNMIVVSCFLDEPDLVVCMLLKLHFLRLQCDITLRIPWHLSVEWYYLKGTINLHGTLMTRPQPLGLPSGFSVWENAFCLHSFSLVKHVSLKGKGGKKERGRGEGEEDQKDPL